MASTLSATQRQVLFRALDVIYGTSYYTISAMGTLSVSTDMAVGGQVAAYNQILSYIDVGNGDGLPHLTSDAETELKSLLTLYGAIEFSAASIRGGGIGKICGMTYDPADKREILRTAIKLIVPDFRSSDVSARKAKAENAPDSLTIPILR